ncbi:sulfatase-like hydrolase/transferase [Flavobacteriaceae bacterium S356]|uniref:Sulfatase-like hydrolase/transferase n=1 Tax=Asprobacillus argus TaxID=3076534 RepID=A0ABU3LG82_9FLAO|nr:sulfatase-like hydrolase/transferase [Flavobacteriaceae bacterium S356]
MIKKLPNYIRYIVLNVLFLFIFSFVFRLIFFFALVHTDNVSGNEISTAFLFGVRFDVKLAILTFFPLALLILIVNHSFFKRKIYKIIATIYLVLAYLALTVFYLIDIGYYSYLYTRLDAASLRFLSNLKISTQLLWESYPVLKGAFGLLVLILATRFMTRYHYKKTASAAMHPISKKIKAVYFIGIFLLLSFGIYGSFTHYPLRWSQAFFSKNNTINQFSLNPVLNFFDSFAFRNEGVDLEKTKAYYPVIADYLNIPSDSINFQREVTFDSIPEKKPNIVVVMLESLGVVPMGFYGNPANGTPYMDKLMQESVHFDNFYVHKPGTAGSVFASITGLADIDDVKTASRNARVVDQRIIFDQFEGYEKFYFLGGSANWANIRGVFQSNIKDLKIYEEGSYEVEDRADVWGIDDYDLFKESDKILSELHKKETPFVAYIQTATNHRPFTVPDEKGSFRPLKEGEISEDVLKKAGFISLAQLNALRYLDFNVDVFLRRAKESGYYDNSIFVFFGDHNTSMNPTANFKKEFDLEIQVHHVPFFIHAPKYVKAKKITNVAKLVDLFPTAASIARTNYTNYTLGSNAMDTLNTDSFGFVHLKIKGEPAVGLIQNGFYYSKTNQTNTTNLYKLTDAETVDVSTLYPKVVSKMDSLITSYYHSTKYLYYNNKKLNK